MTTKASYEVLEGKLHKGGFITVEVLPDSSKFSVKVQFDIQKKMLVPVPADYLKGDYTLELPLEFKDERGYLELESKGSIDISKAQVKFIKRETIGKWTDAFEAEVLPSNGKFKLRAYYHPDIPAVGWARLDLVFLMDIPMLKNYEIAAVLKE